MFFTHLLVDDPVYHAVLPELQDIYGGREPEMKLVSIHSFDSFSSWHPHLSCPSAGSDNSEPPQFPDTELREAEAARNLQIQQHEIRPGSMDGSWCIINIPGGYGHIPRDSGARAGEIPYDVGPGLSKLNRSTVG